jgi:hypothetical protein
MCQSPSLGYQAGGAAIDGNEGALFSISKTGCAWQGRTANTAGRSRLSLVLMKVSHLTFQIFLCYFNFIEQYLCR